MSKRVFIIDGMLSGTGIRDGINGCYIGVDEIGISEILRRRIEAWLARYERAHYYQYKNKDETESLDLQGIKIAKILKTEFPEATVKYFSSANMVDIPLERAAAMPIMRSARP